MASERAAKYSANAESRSLIRAPVRRRGIHARGGSRGCPAQRSTASRARCQGYASSRVPAVRGGGGAPAGGAEKGGGAAPRPRGRVGRENPVGGPGGVGERRHGVGGARA